MSIRVVKNVAPWGDWAAICDRCGAKYLGSTMKTQWDNLFVCDRCFEPRNEQDFVEAGDEHSRVPPVVRTTKIDNNNLTNTPLSPTNDSENWYGNGSIT